ncbi:MAG: CpXC domain-containing protein [Aquabacterium sp.]
MSIFQGVELPCPSCRNLVRFELVYSVNAARRPDLRDAILDRSFQREACGVCGHEFRMEPEFSYTDVVRKQFYGVFPGNRCDDWQALEAKVIGSFNLAYGPGSGAESLGDGMQVRVVFGWHGLHEKMVAADAGIADTSLELAKVVALRQLGEFRLDPDLECRLLGQDGDDLLVGWLRESTGELVDQFAFARSLVAEIEADADRYAPLRDRVSGPAFVDFRRMLRG